MAQAGATPCDDACKCDWWEAEGAPSGVDHDLAQAVPSLTAVTYASTAYISSRLIAWPA